MENLKRPKTAETRAKAARSTRQSHLRQRTAYLRTKIGSAFGPIYPDMIESTGWIYLLKGALLATGEQVYKIGYTAFHPGLRFEQLRLQHKQSVEDLQICQAWRGTLEKEQWFHLTNRSHNIATLGKEWYSFYHEPSIRMAILNQSGDYESFWRNSLVYERAISDFEPLMARAINSANHSQWITLLDRLNRGVEDPRVILADASSMCVGGGPDDLIALYAQFKQALKWKDRALEWPDVLE